jgi:hypothetical protein
MYELNEMGQYWPSLGQNFVILLYLTFLSTSSSKIYIEQLKTFSCIEW